MNIKPENIQSFRIYEKINWLIQLRWLSLLFYTLIGALGFVFVGTPTRENLAPYLGCLSLLLTFNIFIQIYYSSKLRKLNEISICFHMAFDLFILSLFFILTNAIESPFMTIFFLHASLGALLIVGRYALPFIVFCHSFVLAIQLNFVENNLDVMQKPTIVLNFLLFHFLLFLFWFVLRRIGSYLENESTHKTETIIKEERQDRLRAIGALTSGLSHEFASPLTTAKIRIERLMRQSQTTDTQEALKAILECESVIRKINEIQIDSQNIISQEVDLIQTTKDIIERWQLDHPKTTVILSGVTKLYTSIPAIHFSQTLVNLLDNANDANSEQPININISKQQNKISVSIEDQGLGFSEEVLEKIGEPFNTTKQQGTGLGLYISQLFTQSLGGELIIQNLKTGGALVKLTWLDPKWVR